MRIRSIHLKDFKRFVDLTIENIPETAKLVILVGPSGSGKSSLFEAINAWGKDQRQSQYDSEYYKRDGHFTIASYMEQFSNLGVTIEADDPPSNLGEACYIRSAYRHTPKFSSSSIMKVDETEYWRYHGQRNFSTPDDEVQRNYQRVYGQMIKEIFNSNTLTNVEIREDVIGKVREALQSIFPELQLHSLEDPEGKGTFYFEKGAAKKYNYVNLSGGEKAAFDLLLDFIVRGKNYPNAAMCIDEPEGHMGLSAQGKLLQVLYQLIPEKSQLWLGTHSIGILRASKKILEENPGKVVYLDFSGHDFDQKVEIKPIMKPDRDHWQKLHNSVLDDLSGLLAPDKIIVCESTSGTSGFDSHCYNQIFSEYFPDALFVSAGSKSELEKIIPILQGIIQNSEIFVVRDRDGMLDKKREKLIKGGTRVLTRRTIEDYLVDHEVLDKFASEYGLDTNQLQILKNITKDNAKANSGQIYQIISNNFRLTVGDDREEFLSDVLAPLFRDNMTVFQELKTDIFGE